MQQARKKALRAVDLAKQSAGRERASVFATGPALWEALLGNAPAARRMAAEALELSKDREVEYGAAVALAIAGDSGRPQTIAVELERRFPEDTAVQFSYLPVLRALLALNHGEPAKAIELLQLTVPYELGSPPSAFFGFFGALYPVYVRGEAYLAAHQGAEAAAELLAEGDFELIRRCESESCVLWFYDRTKSHRRRWCSMASCGNRHKVAAFRSRRSNV